MNTPTNEQPAYSSPRNGAVPDMPERRVLAVQDLDVSFRLQSGIVPAVRELSLTVDEGETVAVVGESGSGKSVTSLSIMRLVEHGGGRIDRGRLLMKTRSGDTVDLARASQSTMRRLRGADLAMVFQEPMTSLNPVFKVGEQIAESIRLHQGLGASAASAEALRMLDVVRIPQARNVMGRHPHQLSGGMRQRVMIAMALACKPRLLIADEPTTALDVTIQAQILALIAQLQKEMGMGVIFITHDMGVVAEIADRVVVMLRGRAVEENDCATLFRTPRNAYTRALLAAVPRLGSMNGRDAPERFAQPPQGAGEPASRSARIAVTTPADATTADAAPACTTPAGDEPATHTNAAERTRTVSPPIDVLRVRDLVTRFALRSGVFNRVTHEVHAVDHVSFDLRRGETLAVVGESGSGKSTLGRTIARLIDATSGSVEVAGRDVRSIRGAHDMKALRRDIQFIFQDPFASLDPRQTIGYSVLEPLLVHGISPRAQAEQRARDLLVRVGLPPDAAQRYPHEFSGGQRQRIAIARALTLNPKIIIADEAVAALDVSIRAHVINLLMDLQAELGIAYLFISHDMAVVERISHRVAVMYLGQIVEFGPRRALFENPLHPYTQRLLEAVPIADPSQRRERLLDASEIPSPIHRSGDEVAVAPLVEAEPGHFVATHSVGAYRIDGDIRRAA